MPGSESVHVSRIGPGGQPRGDVELAQDTADQLVDVGFGTQAIELGHHFRERLFGVADRGFRVVLALLLEAVVTTEADFAP